ncbi:NADP-dependent oxidoreductase [Microbacterium sediminicola]|uniref:NADP-dependent oxidoreductase n=1 Tax=Microbacterium sediminicola TaxID=415210 RepID=A0ABN2I3C4_9MICO
MRAVVYTAFGGPDVLHTIEIPTPEAGPGRIVVRVEAAGVNPIDAKLRSGMRASQTIDKPRRIGMDGAGIVVDVGPDVDGFRVGDPVVFARTFGAYAEFVAVKADAATLRPANVSAAAAAGIGIPFATAYQSLRSLDVRSDDVLLIHGGSGAVGQAAIQFATLWGAEVIATASPARAETVAELGATPVSYADDVVAAVRATGLVPTVVLDAAGADAALAASLELVPDRSRIATIVRGADAAGLGIRAFSGGSPEPLTAQQEAWRVEALPVTVNLLAAGAARIEEGPAFSMADAGDAHRAVMAGARGKVTIRP